MFLVSLVVTEFLSVQEVLVVPLSDANVLLGVSSYRDISIDGET